MTTPSPTLPADPLASPAVADAGTPQERVLLHMPVDIRSAALGVIAVLGVVFMLRWASAVFIPVMLGLVFSYALSPLVNRMARWRIPRGVAAGVLIVGILGGFVGTAYSLSDDASALVSSLPDATKKLRRALQPPGPKQPSAIETVQKAATELQEAAEASGGSSAAPRGVTRVQIERPKFNVQDYLWSGGIGVVTFIGQTIVICLITFFLVASGDSFRRKLVKMSGPTIAKRKITVQVLDEINAQIQRYLLVQVFTSALVGVATGLVFMMLKLEHAAVWGVVAAVLNLIPYVGSIAVTLAASLVAFLQFGTIDGALAVGGSSLIIQSIEGYLVTPWLTSRASRMSPVVVFVGVLAWGWLWGVWGLLLGIPILMAVKAVCDRVDDLKPFGELLGD